jgi:hypothetical protein
MIRSLSDLAKVVAEQNPEIIYLKDEELAEILSQMIVLPKAPYRFMGRPILLKPRSR